MLHMFPQIELIPIFNDNYVFCFRGKEPKQVCLVDPGDAGPCSDFLRAQNLQLDTILITHHHADHIGGVAELMQMYPQCRVIAPAQNQQQIPFATHYCAHNDVVQVLGLEFHVLALAGHTLGHVGYFEASAHVLFSGDVLFGLGCGRIFEGTFAQMYEALQVIKALPQKALVYCTHEYTQRNLDFLDWLWTNHKELLSISEDERLQVNVAIQKRLHDSGQTVPLSLQFELQFNPFLKARSVEEFKRLRELRNQF